MRSLVAALFLTATLAGTANAAVPGPPSHNVAWRAAASDADIERAIAQARSETKPLLLYWGATWCPPCNRLKATLFNRADFAAEARSFVAVHIDGDRPGAQALGRRFKINGYPTLLLLKADGSEITRLPIDVEPQQIVLLMQQGLSSGRSAKAVLADAMAGKTLPANEWRLLAFYAWELDEQRLVPRSELPALLAKLSTASATADTETQTRLWLKAVAAIDPKHPDKGLRPDAALRERMQRLLADPAQVRLHADALAYNAADIVRGLTAGSPPERSPLVPAFDAALQRLTADTTLSRGDRLVALYSRVGLARLGLPEEAVRVKLPETLLIAVRTHIAGDDRDIADGYERQAVIPLGAGVLGYAGLWAESDALLKSNLGKSLAPYYLMADLGGNARKLGRNDEALSWYQQAFDQSEGPATRLQWGSDYLEALVDLAPGNAAQIEKVAAQLFAEAAKDGGAFEGRSARAMQRLGKKLVDWNAHGRQAPALKRLQAQLDPVCAKQPLADGQRAACRALLKPGKTA
jgi:thioredoxin-like negative regulator of GroEL